MTIPSFPLTLETIRAGAERALGAVQSVELLSGDASTRRFVRIHLDGASSAIAMVFEEPVDRATHPQFLVGDFLESEGLPVPKLIAAIPEAGLLFYQDLGDALLQDLAREAGLDAGGRSRDVAASGPPGAIVALERLYDQAVTLILEIQDATARLPAGHPSATSALDAERLRFEMRFFREHYVEGLRGLHLGPREAVALDRFLEDLADCAAAPPWVLCHRDYHARNLLVQEGRLRLVDFQDARMGSPAYDLASLLRDSYVSLPDDLQERLLGRFVGSGGRPDGDRDAFRRRLETVALQRNLKALGTFGYQATVRGRTFYLDHVPRTWDHAFDALGRLPEWKDAVPLLELIADRPR